MARTALTPQTIVGKYPGTVSAGDADITFAAGDASNGNSFTLTGQEIIIARNDDAAAQTITIDSVPDPQNRTGDITSYSIGASEYAAFGPFPGLGWKQSDGTLHIDVGSANIKLAILRLPV